MKLICFQDHRYPSSGDEFEQFKAGQVYDVPDPLASRLLADWGPASYRRDKTGGNAPVKFDMATPEHIGGEALSSSLAGELEAAEAHVAELQERIALLPAGEEEGA